jgi:hypothetical protein
MDLLGFSKDKVVFLEIKICLYHIQTGGHKGSGLDPLRPAAQQAAARGARDWPGAQDPEDLSMASARVGKRAPKDP